MSSILCVTEDNPALARRSLRLTPCVSIRPTPSGYRTARGTLLIHGPEVVVVGVDVVPDWPVGDVVVVAECFFGFVGVVNWDVRVSGGTGCCAR